MRKIAIITIIFVLFACISVVSAADDNSTLATADLEVTSDCDDDLLAVESEISVTDDNYDQYFNKFTGKFRDTASSVETVKIGNVSDKIFTFDRPVNVMPLSDDSQIRNGVIHLIAGSDGSKISNLIINNTKGEITHEGIFVSKLHGIWLSNSSSNLISGNTIVIAEAEGCYAMPMGYSSNNRIVYNDITSHITSCLVMGSCHNNIISYNRIEVLSVRELVTSNLIYFNKWGHADYHGPADCVGNIISNNQFIGFCNSIWSIILKCEGQSDNTQIINNTVYKGSTGIQLYDEISGDQIQAKNCLIKDNTVINSTYSIVSGSNDVEIVGNKIIGYAMDTGISVCDFSNSNASVHDNTIEYTNLYGAISVGATNATVYNNVIKLSNYGVGIGVSGNNISVFENNIKTTADCGIVVTGSNSNIHDNRIVTFGSGISLDSKRVKEKVYNTTIYRNTILSDDYPVYINGYVFNTTIRDNTVETNQSEAFYINVIETLEDRQGGSVTDNSVNGVIENTETLIIDDDNFYDYFDENGYLTYEFEKDSKRIIFFTHLTNKDVYFTDKIILTSNKMANLLYNVSITFTNDACDSSISDFKFYNQDKASIILDGVENVDVKNNEFTTVGNEKFTLTPIEVSNGCENVNIVGNSIFINSKTSYAFGISITDDDSKIKKRFSKNFNIADNNILIKTSGVGEGIYIDALVESLISNNNINIISEDSAYGISICNVFGAPHDIKIDSNEIILNSNEMSYLIELYVANDCKITNNYLKSQSNGIYGVATYRASGITIDDNEIVVSSKGLTSFKVSDALGKGQAAISTNRTSLIESISGNIFDVENASVMQKDNSIIKKYENNSYVISNYNHQMYFDNHNTIVQDVIKENETILFKNFTSSKVMDVNIPVTISPYKHLNDFNAILILSGNANNSTISGLNFKDATLELNGVCDVNITLNKFSSSKLSDSGSNNSILFNTFRNCRILFENSLNATFESNNVSLNNFKDSDFLSITGSENLNVLNNSFNVSGSIVNIINSKLSMNNSIINNTFEINGTKDICVYKSIKSNDSHVLTNNINSNVDFNNCVIYGDAYSHNNDIEYNRIISKSGDGRDFAVVFDTESNQGNIIANNYLISSNGYLKGNDAVSAVNEVVCNNTPYDLYVSVNVNGSENGSMAHPYSTISKALENSLSGSVIYVLPGYYNESNLVIDKNITLTAINNEGNVYIDALNKALFNITGTGILTVNALKILNGFSQLGGSLFYNMGKLIINNSMIYNSSAYYDNSNPSFTKNELVANTWDSEDCSNTGLGGAILNYGEMEISSSELFNNFAHKGGAIADFGKTTIKNSKIYANTAVHGGAVYTNSNSTLTIDHSQFSNNLAITTLDYCSIKKTGKNPPYTYLTNCEEEAGHGGAIYSNTSMMVKDSLFENNTAKCGGAIAFPTDLVQYGYHDLDYKRNSEFGDIDLIIENSKFRYNNAKNTKYGNQTMLEAPNLSVDTYGSNFHGGAIFGSLDEMHMSDSLFEDNTAHGNGGALCVQTRNSTTENCKFYNNTAGANGGALDIFGNSQVFNTEIRDNSAKNGGAVQYSSYEYYSRIQNNLDMFNVTVSGNKALDKGGAFKLVGGNIAVTNSNIYGNSAPNGATFTGGGNVDVRSNWWGSTNGPDDSVWNLANVRFRTWLSDKVNWEPTSINNKPADNNPNKGNGENNGRSYNPSDSTGSSVRTGSTLSRDSSGYSGNSGGYAPSGNWPSGNEKGGSLDLKGFLSRDKSGNSKTDVNGNQVNENSLSKINSSTVNDLPSVGMSANAADSSASASGSQGQGKSGESQKAYEITKEIKKEIEVEDNLVNIIFVLIALLLLVIGFYRKYNTSE